MTEEELKKLIKSGRFYAQAGYINAPCYQDLVLKLCAAVEELLAWKWNQQNEG